MPLLRDGGEMPRCAGARAAAEPAAHGGRETCELCPIGISDEHKHLIHLDERRIVCVCATCWALRSGDAEFRPVGNRRVWLDGLRITDEQWAAFADPDRARVLHDQLGHAAA